VKLVAPGLGSAEVEVSIEVNDREGAMLSRERTQHRQRDRVIAADEDWRDLPGGKSPDLGLDRSPHRGAIERREDDVTGIDTAQPLEHVDPVHRMMALKQRRYAAHVIRRESGSRLIRRTAVVRDTEQRGIGIGRRGRAWQAEERRLAVAEIHERGVLHEQERRCGR